MVDLEPVTGPDVDLVRGRVQEHQQLTGSTVAERLLEDWGSSIKLFVKVSSSSVFCLHVRYMIQLISSIASRLICCLCEILVMF